MIKENDLLNYTNASILEDARDLYYAGHIGTVKMIRGNYNVLEITSKVKDARGYSTYEPTVYLNQDADQILDYTCTCEHTPNQMCEHQTSVLIKTIYDNLKPPHPILNQPQQPQTTTQTSWKRSTALELKHLINSYTEQANSLKPILQKTTNIQALPELNFLPNHTIALSLRIGQKGTRKYLVRNLSTFATNMQRQAFDEYGKNLSFYHSIDAFDEPSKPLIQFILQLINITNTEYQEYIYLEGAILDQFIDHIAFKSPSFSLLHYLHNNVEHNCTIYDTIDDLDIKLIEKDDGYQLSSNPFHIYKGYNFLYLKPTSKQRMYRISANNQNITPFLEYLQETKGKPQYLSQADLPAFIQDVFPNIQQTLPIQTPNLNLDEYMKETPTIKIYLDAPNKDTLTAKVEATYKNNQTYNILNTDKDTYANRNLPHESKIEQTIAPMFNTYDEQSQTFAIIDHEEMFFNLLYEGLQTLQQLGQVFISTRLKAYTIQTPSKFDIGISVQSGLLKLDIGSKELKPEELSEILSRYDEKKSFYRLKNGQFIQANEALKDLNQLQETLHFSKKQIKDENILIPTYRALSIDNLTNNTNNLLLNYDDHFYHLIENMNDIQHKQYTPPEPLNQILRDYQKKGYSWLNSLYENGFCGLLADEMGLGKTIQVIAFVKGLKNRKRVLIVSPASLVYNWAAEFKHFASDLPIRLIAGNQEERAHLIASSNDDDIIITSYDLLKRDITSYLPLEFSAEIIDEAQFIKNPKTKAARAVKGINSNFRIALTGTPIENRLSELWSIFDYLMPGFLYSYKQFQNDIEYPIVLLQDEEAKQRLQNMVAPFTLRRLKKDVLQDLPDKLEEVLYAPLEGEQKELYQASVQNLTNALNNESNDDFNKHRIEVLAEITKLRETCCSPALLYKNYQGNSAKEDMCIDLINRAVNSNHKVLLFSQFTSMLDILVKRLEQEGIKYHMLTGSTPKKERANLVEQFQNDDVPVFCISLKAGGTGLNLTAADIVIHYDPWWNTAAENQASDRAHRIGQESIVTVYRLILEGSIEEKILHMQQEKADLANGVLQDQAMASSTLSKDDLLKLL